jgi:hypothetical protein
MIMITYYIKGLHVVTVYDGSTNNVVGFYEGLSCLVTNNSDKSNCYAIFSRCMHHGTNKNENSTCIAVCCRPLPAHKMQMPYFKIDGSVCSLSPSPPKTSPSTLLPLKGFHEDSSSYDELSEKIFP